MFLYYKYKLVLNVRQAAMATQQDVSLRHCVVIKLHCADEERILKYLYEHVYSYQWILREDKETESICLCVWWRENDCRLFCTSPLRSFLKRLKNKAGYEKIHISNTLTTKEGIHTLCNDDLGCISKYYAEGPLYVYLREALSLEPPQMVEFSPEKEKCNRILQMTSTLRMPAKLDLLQKFTSALVPQINQQLDTSRPHILPDPPSPLITEPADSPPHPIPIVSEFDPFLLSSFPPSTSKSETY